MLCTCGHGRSKHQNAVGVCTVAGCWCIEYDQDISQLFQKEHVQDTGEHENPWEGYDEEGVYHEKTVRK